MNGADAGALIVVQKGLLGSLGVFSGAIAGNKSAHALRYKASILDIAPLGA
jgi:hypothetical protein